MAVPSAAASASWRGVGAPMGSGRRGGGGWRGWSGYVWRIRCALFCKRRLWRRGVARRKNSGDRLGRIGVDRPARESVTFGHAFRNLRVRYFRGQGRLTRRGGFWRLNRCRPGGRSGRGIRASGRWAWGFQKRRSSPDRDDQKQSKGLSQNNRFNRRAFVV
jgi:hypothetical protein